MSRTQPELQFATEPGQQMQKHGRVETATQPDPDVTGGDGKLSPVLGDKRRELSRRQFP